MTACIRRPGSIWTLCKCDTCRADIARKAKLRRNGHAVVDDRRAEARARLAQWRDAGYSVGVIAHMTGIRVATLAEHVNGTRNWMTHSTAEKILNATAPTDAAGFIPSTGTWRRLRALTVMGWSMSSLSTRTGVPECTLHALRDPAHATTRPRFAAAVATVYDELSMTPGPCRYAATRARRKGWLPPLAWDDIDDPSETPGATATDDGLDEVAVLRLMEGSSTTSTLEERTEAVRRLASRGMTDRAIAERIGQTERNVHRVRVAHHIESRWIA